MEHALSIKPSSTERNLSEKFSNYSALFRQARNVMYTKIFLQL